MENPTVELPKTEEPAKVIKPAELSKPAVNVDELLVELERAGVTNVPELQNKFKASSEVGRVAQLLGDERKRSRELEEQIAQLSNRPARATEDPFAASSSGPIDIEAAIERSVEKVFTTREVKAQKIQQANIAAWNQIQQDEDYPLVQNVWENKLKDPNFVFKIQSGMVDPINAYTETVRKFYKEMMKKSVETIRHLKGGTPPATPPHVESGERTSANLVSETPSTDSQKKLDKYKKVVKEKGVLSDAEQLDLLDTIFAGPQKR